MGTGAEEGRSEAGGKKGKMKRVGIFKRVRALCAVALRESLNSQV
jgi:hypothetical protein